MKETPSFVIIGVGQLMSAVPKYAIKPPSFSFSLNGLLCWFFWSITLLWHHDKSFHHILLYGNKQSLWALKIKVRKQNMKTMTHENTLKLQSDNCSGCLRKMSDCLGEFEGHGHEYCKDFIVRFTVYTVGISVLM